MGPFRPTIFYHKLACYFKVVRIGKWILGAALFWGSLPSMAGAQTALLPGDVALSAIVRNGNSQIGFVSTKTLDSGTTVYFTNYSWNSSLNGGLGGLVDESVSIGSSATTVIEGTASYIVGPGGLAAFTPVYFGNTGNASNQLQGGAVANVLGGGGNAWVVMNHNGNGEKLLLYTAAAPLALGAPPSGATFLTGAILGPHSWLGGGSSPATFFDSNLPSGLNSANSIDLSPLWNGNPALSDPSAITAQNQSALLSPCQNSLSAVLDPANWVGNTASKGGLSLTNQTGSSATRTPGPYPLGMGICGVGNAGVTFNATATASFIAPGAIYTNTPSNTFTPGLPETSTATGTSTPAALLFPATTDPTDTFFPTATPTAPHA